jgi:hypothetical protein
MELSMARGREDIDRVFYLIRASCSRSGIAGTRVPVMRLTSFAESH